MRSKKSQRSGYVAMLSVLLVSVIAATTVLILFVTSMNSTLNSGDVVQSKMAKSMAESCAELALQYLSDNTANPDTAHDGTRLVVPQTGECEIYDIEDLTSDNYRIRTTGSGAMDRLVKYYVVEAYRHDPVDPSKASGAIVTCWKECADLVCTPC